MNTVPSSVDKLLAQMTTKDLAESAEQVARIVKNVKAGVCPSCGISGLAYTDDRAHLEASPTCPVARLRPLARKILNDTSKR